MVAIDAGQIGQFFLAEAFFVAEQAEVSGEDGAQMHAQKRAALTLGAPPNILGIHLAASPPTGFPRLHGCVDHQGVEADAARHRPL